MSAVVRFQPRWGVPPGESLAELLKRRGLSQSDLARRAGRSVKTINDVVHGRSPISPETALQLERVLGVDASTWLRLEADYREGTARDAERADLAAQVEWLQRFPLQDLKRLSVLPAEGDKAVLLGRLLKWFGVATPAAWEHEWAQPSAAFRQSEAFDVSRYAISAWIRMAERKAEQRDVAPFNATLVRESLNDLRALTRQPPASALLEAQELCGAAGIALEWVPALSKTHVYGVTRWMSPQKVLVVLSNRYRREDHLWFTFFHECAHVLLHPKKSVFVDIEIAQISKVREEAEANQFAGELLIPTMAYEDFADDGDFSEGAVRAFAARIGISPGIIVGRLQRDGLVMFSQMNTLRQEVNLSDTLHGGSPDPG